MKGLWCILAGIFITILLVTTTPALSRVSEVYLGRLTAEKRKLEKPGEAAKTLEMIRRKFLSLHSPRPVPREATNRSSINHFVCVVSKCQS
jgi:hypothetical protein